MQSKAATVDAYLAEAPEERREAMAKLREVCRSTLTGYSEGMEYGMACYRKGGGRPIAFASQVGYVALYGVPGTVQARYKAELKRFSAGKGCIRYRDVKKMDFAVIAKMLGETAAEG